MDVAKSFGIAPWALEHPDRPPTEGETSLWYFRAEYRLRVEL